MDVDDVGDGPQDEQFHFKVVLKNPSQKIVIPVAPGSGGRVAAGSFIVTSHAAIRMADDTVRLSSAPLTAGPMHDCTQVMDLFDCGQGVDDIKANCIQWSRVDMTWTLNHLPGTICQNAITHVVTTMILRGAHQGRHLACGYRAGNGEDEVLKALVLNGLAHHINVGGVREWFLTRAGIRDCVSVSSIHSRLMPHIHWHLLVVC